MGDAPESYSAEVEGLESLERAIRGASGVRRAVLVRRLAEARLDAGKTQEAVALVNGLGRLGPERSPLPPGAEGDALVASFRTPLDAWHTLSPEEAQLAAELVRAEALTHLLRADDVATAFGDLERRLASLNGRIANHLWVRWAKSWSWVLSEVLGQPAKAIAACEKVRARVPPDQLASDVAALGFIRAEEVACSSAGDLAKAHALVEEHIALAERLGDVREQCLGWNARGIVRFGSGELPGAKAAFERAVELARLSGWTRREAISTHNLSLVLLELGELDATDAAEHHYARLSVPIGNHAATSEAPLVLARVALARGDFAACDALLASARRAAESNAWPMLVLQARAIAGRRALLEFVKTRDRLALTRARNELLASLDGLEEHHTAWSEELDPAEVYAQYAAALRLSGQLGHGREVLIEAKRRIPAANVVSHATLAVGEAFVEGRPLDESLAWFDQRGYARLARFWRSLG